MYPSARQPASPVLLSLDRLLGAGVLVAEHDVYRASSIALYGSFQPAAAPFASAM